jgi:hypothetical protein
LVYEVVEAAGINHPFHRESQMAGWYWWNKLRERYNLSLRTPQNQAIHRASMANRALIDDLYDKVERVVTELDLKCKPARLWNCVKTGLTSHEIWKKCQPGREKVCL